MRTSESLGEEEWVGIYLFSDTVNIIDYSAAKEMEIRIENQVNSLPTVKHFLGSSSMIPKATNPGQLSLYALSLSCESQFICSEQ